MLILLIAIGIVLIILNYKAIKKEKFNFVLRNEEVNLDEVSLKIGELRREFAETILELSLEIKELKKENSLIKSELLKNKTDNNYNAPKQDKKNEKKANLNTKNSQEVKALINEGFTDEEICKKLNMGRGELLLIKDLYL